MSSVHTLAVQPIRLWRFLGVFQTPTLRVVHALVIFFCLLQFMSSWWMQVSGASASFSAWYHMWGGTSLCCLAIIQVVISLTKRGVRHFYPYLWGDTEQLVKDIKQSLHFKLVGPRPKGLGAVVQGLGLGALLLTAFSGLYWFWLWQAASPKADTLRMVHDVASFLLILYFLGHGTMALLHFVVWEEHSKQED